MSEKPPNEKIEIDGKEILNLAEEFGGGVVPNVENNFVEQVGVIDRVKHGKENKEEWDVSGVGVKGDKSADDKVVKMSDGEHKENEKETIQQLTVEANGLLKTLDDGGVLGYVNNNVRRILVENGVSSEDTRTKKPEELMNELRAKKRAFEMAGLNEEQKKSLEQVKKTLNNRNEETKEKALSLGGKTFLKFYMAAESFKKICGKVVNYEVGGKKIKYYKGAVVIGLVLGLGANYAIRKYGGEEIYENSALVWNSWSGSTGGVDAIPDSPLSDIDTEINTSTADTLDVPVHADTTIEHTDPSATNKVYWEKPVNSHGARTTIEEMWKQDISEGLDNAQNQFTYEVIGGDNNWNNIEGVLDDGNFMEGFNEKQRLFTIDSIKDELVKLSPEELKDMGNLSGDPSIINPGDKIDYRRIIESALEKNPDLLSHPISEVDLPTDLSGIDSDTVNPTLTMSENIAQNSDVVSTTSKINTVEPWSISPVSGTEETTCTPWGSETPSFKTINPNTPEPPEPNVYNIPTEGDAQSAVPKYGWPENVENPFDRELFGGGTSENVRDLFTGHSPEHFVAMENFIDKVNMSNFPKGLSNFANLFEGNNVAKWADIAGSNLNEFCAIKPTDINISEFSVPSRDFLGSVQGLIGKLNAAGYKILDMPKDTTISEYILKFLANIRK